MMENPIRKRRLELGISRAELGRRCGLGLAALQRLEQWSPRGPRDWEALAAALEIQADELRRQYAAWLEAVRSSRAGGQR